VKVKDISILPQFLLLLFNLDKNPGEQILMMTIILNSAAELFFFLILMP
jgi:hypothetical protein